MRPKAVPCIPPGQLARLEGNTPPHGRNVVVVVVGGRIVVVLVEVVVVVATGRGADTRGRIRVTIGNGAADASGVQIRMSIPELATTWSDGQGCPANATCDNGESLVSQLVLSRRRRVRRERSSS